MASIRIPLRAPDGRLVAPPEPHIADFLARDLSLNDEDWIICHAPIEANTVEVADKLQDCYIGGRAERARHFGPVLDALHGRGFVHMCQECVDK